MSDCEDVFHQEIGITCKNKLKLIELEKENKKLLNFIDYIGKTMDSSIKLIEHHITASNDKNVGSLISAIRKLKGEI